MPRCCDGPRALNTSIQYCLSWHAACSCKGNSALPPLAPQRTARLQKRLLPDHIHSYSRSFTGGAFFSFSHSKQYWLSSMWAVMKGHTKCKLSILDQFCRANMLWRPHNGRFHLIFTQGTFAQKRLISFIG